MFHFQTVLKSQQEMMVKRAVEWKICYHLTNTATEHGIEVTPQVTLVYKMVTMVDVQMYIVC